MIVLGHIVRSALGGMVWSSLQYLKGLAQLGHRVYYLEDSDDFPSCYDPTTGLTGTDPGFGLSFASQVLGQIGLSDRWAFYDAHAPGWIGPLAGQVPAICRKADVLLNVTGLNPIRPWFSDVPCRVLIDQDPVFTQIDILKNDSARERAERHTSFFSFGENIPGKKSLVPDDGLPWQATRQPVVLDGMPVTAGPVNGKYTTVMQWRSYRAVKYEGVRYGMKSDSFTEYLDLPERAGDIFQLAVASGSGGAILSGRGWKIIDALEASRDPRTYEQFLQRSKAEFAVAKHGYVIGRTGWFSERTAAYLALGRPALAQETGFSSWLPTGSGLIPFTSSDEALAGIAEIDSRYSYHCGAAREIAEAHFEAGQVLTSLLERALVTRWTPGTVGKLPG